MRDALFVATVIALSAALYVTQLGFASDDWAFLGSLTTHGDLSAPGRSLEHNFADYLRPRPVVIAYQTSLYSAFGLDPVGYHTVNTLVLALMCAFGYLVLRELEIPQRSAVAIAVLYGFLPHYSTARFWWAAFGYGAAMALAFASLYADLQALRRRGVSVWLWKAAALVALAASGLGVELAVPLLAAAVPLLWYRSRQPDALISHGMSRLGLTVFLGSNVAVLAGIMAFKAASSVGLGVPGGYIYHVARLGLGSTAASFGSYGVGLLGSTRWAIATVDGPTVIAGMGLASAVGVYLVALARRDPSTRWTVGSWLRLLGLGLLVFALGYVIFLTNSRILFSSTGISNRVAIAAAPGVAMIWVGVAGALSAAVPLRWRAGVFAVPVAALCLSGFLVVHALAATWAEAWERQRIILSEIRERLPMLEPDTTIILDGTCSYVGPAIVFESNWDLAGALETLYRDPTVRADVVSANLSVGEEGLMTRIYGSQTAHYRYGPRLLVFDPREAELRPLPDATAAHTWWSTREPPDCPRGAAGYGRNLFHWDLKYRRLEDNYLWR